MPTIRVATTQYHVANDVEANLNKLLDFIDQAAAGGAQLIVAPEFGNHSSFYTDINQAWDVAITVDGAYVKAVQDKAKQKNMFVVFNATRRGECSPTAYISNFLIGPDGELIGIDDKQVLMGGEAQNLSGSQQEGQVFDTAIGKIGMGADTDPILAVGKCRNVDQAGEHTSRERRRAEQHSGPVEDRNLPVFNKQLDLRLQALSAVFHDPDARGCLLLRGVEYRGTDVAEVTNVVAVDIRLVRVGDRDTVIAGVINSIVVAVTQTHRSRPQRPTA